jgi:tetratricopeptide (TPR) repeat protein
MPPVAPTPTARTDQGAAPANPATPSLKPAPVAPAIETAPPTTVAAEEPPTPAPRNDKIAPTPPAPGPRGDNRKPPRRIDTRKPDRSRPAEVATPAPRVDKKRSGKALQDVKAEAKALYMARNFSGASSALTSALSGFGTDDTKELKSLAALYSQLGKSYAVGMAPGTKYPEAYQALRRAIDYDHDLGATYVPALQDRLVNTATRAASSYMAAHEYELAFQAVRTSESLGSTSSNNKTVRTMLEDIASDLYRTAASELSSDPEGAKKKARQILGIVDTRNPLFAKAQKLINAP